MNIRFNQSRLVTWLTMAIVVAGCGGGDSGGSSGTIAGIDGGGIYLTQGPISGFGSVIVNGVRYDTTGAAISVDGVTAGESSLATGLIVRVEGTVDAGGTTGRAQRVTYESAVRGPVEQVDISAGRLTVLGQPAQVTQDTIFSGPGVTRGLEDLSVGELVTVSGFLNSSGIIVATRIEEQATASTLEVAGIVVAPDSVQRRFRINGVTIDYSSAVLDGFGGSDPAAGQRVFVKSTQGLRNGVLVASSVSRRDTGVPAATGTTVDIEGLITRFASSSDFDVAGQRVQTNASTQYVGGTAQSLAIDASLDIRGQRDSNGVLVATRIEFLPVANITLEATLDGVDTGAGVLRLLGIDVTTTARTRYDDDDSRIFALRDLRIGDTVQIAGYVRDGRFVATRVSRDDDGNSSDVEIEGPVTDVAAPNFRIGGVAITTNAQTEFELEGGGSGAAAFFAAAAGRIAEIEGRWNGVVVTAVEIELEN